MSYLLFQYVKVAGMECTVTVETHLDRRGIHRVTLHPPLSQRLIIPTLNPSLSAAS
jgi:hypothetical protein